jgi:RNA polymerase sigma-70 factor, ECF subfamily
MSLICSIASLFRGKPSVGVKVTELAVAHSFEQVYRDNFSFVWRTVRALGVSPELVDDAVQEVFIVVHRHLDAYVPTASLRSWIFGIVRRVAKDFRRAKKRRGIMVRMEEDFLEADFRDPYVLATQNEALTFVLDFADTLDETWRSVFVLSELEEMSAPEIASALRINLNTVYSRQRSLKRQLSQYVATHAEEESETLYE